MKELPVAIVEHVRRRRHIACGRHFARVFVQRIYSRVYTVFAKSKSSGHTFETATAQQLNHLHHKPFRGLYITHIARPPHDFARRFNNNNIIHALLVRHNNGIYNFCILAERPIFRILERPVSGFYAKLCLCVLRFALDIVA